MTLPGLVRTAVVMNARRVVAFRASFALDVLSSLAFVLISVTFWQVIYARVSHLPGFTLGQTFLFLFFVELFFTLGMSVFVGSGKFWVSINTGRLDIYLTRPGDPRLLLTLITMRLDNLLRAVPSLTLLLGLAVHHHATFSLPTLLAGVVITALGATAYAFLQMASSWVAFWAGRAQVLDELTDSMTELTQYPHTIFPKFLQLALTTVLPFGLAGTQPSLLAAGSAHSLLTGIAVAAAVATGWLVLQHLLWKKGLHAYESSNG